MAFTLLQSFILGFLITCVIYIIKRRPVHHPNEPILVPYSIPILGHTISYLFNPKDFFNECKQKYGEPFNLYVFGEIITVVGSRYASDIFRHPETFSMTEALDDYMPVDLLYKYNQLKLFPYHAKYTREFLSPNLEKFLPNIQKVVGDAIEKYFSSDTDDSVVRDNVPTDITHIMSKSATISFIGSGEDDDELINAFSNISKDFSKFLIPPIFSFIHPSFHKFVASLPFRLGFNPIDKHFRTIQRVIRPIIDKRIKEKRALGDDYIPSCDLLEYHISQDTFNSKNPNYGYITELILVAITLGNTNVGKAAVNSVFDLTRCSQECLDELYEEAAIIDKECNGQLLGIEHLNKMIKLDSFLRESLRHTGDIVLMPYKLVGEGYTFDDGTSIPKGRAVHPNSYDILFNEESYGQDASSFKPFRFLSNDKNVRQLSSTKTSRQFIIFGSGRHACPGRFFAVSELKILIHKILLNYKVRTESGELPKKVQIATIAYPSNDPLVFEKRKGKV